MPDLEAQRRKLEFLGGAIRERLVSLDAYMPSKEILDLDPIWSNPINARSFAKLLADYIRAHPVLSMSNGLVGIDKVRPPFGAFPLLMPLSEELEIPVACWKEDADILTSASRTFGDTSPDRPLLIQDVVARGLTPTRAALELYRDNRPPAAVLTIANLQGPGVRFIEVEYSLRTKMKLPVISILQLPSLHVRDDHFLADEAGSMKNAEDQQEG